MITLYNYKTVSKRANAEIIEKKSRFIAHVLPVDTEEEAISFIDEIRSKHYDARHNVYAYIIKDNNLMRYSDDGEPQGTSGIPTLDVMKKEGLTNVCVVITRYFGGILLGTGGLVRAYSKAAKLGIEEAKIIEKKYCYCYLVTIDYTLLGKVRNVAMELDCIEGDTIYAEDVTFEFYVPADISNFENKIIDVTNGQAMIIKNNIGKYVDV